MNVKGRTAFWQLCRCLVFTSSIAGPSCREAYEAISSGPLHWTRACASLMSRMSRIPQLPLLEFRSAMPQAFKAGKRCQMSSIRLLCLTCAS